MGQNTKTNIKDILVNIVLTIVLLALLVFPAYLCYKIFFVNNPQEENTQDNTQEEVVVEEEKKITIEDLGDEYYDEVLTEIEGQNVYIMTPKEVIIDEDNPPVLIIYNHGSNTVVSNEMDTQFMLDLREYGLLFTKHNYIFTASNAHGANWGSDASIRDNHNLYEYINETYKIQPKIYLIGFSMGGLPTVNFATTYPELISKIALLAPTSHSSQWNQSRVDKIKDMDIQIWHGNKDVNVRYSLSTQLISKIKTYGVTIPLVTLDGKAHFDIDTEYMEDILEFFSTPS